MAVLCKYGSTLYISRVYMAYSQASDPLNLTRHRNSAPVESCRGHVLWATTAACILVYVRLRLRVLLEFPSRTSFV